MEMKKSELTHGSLFSGIGGFELGAEMAGIDTLWNCEIEKFQGEILKNKFPHAERFTDITKTTGLRYVDIISGGFPCQDISVAGKREGIKGKRSGLWSEMYRIIWEVRPKYVIIENSPALTISGLEQVLCDLSKIGYNAEWQCISNYAFGYPHKRERLYLIAYSNKIGLQGDVCKCGSINSIFKQWTSDTSVGYTCAKRILEIPAHSTVRNDDGFPDWSHRVGSIGNAVGAEWRVNSVWHKTKDEVPQAHGEYENEHYPQIPCLVYGKLSTGTGYGVRYWNVTEQCWDDEECDDYECSKDAIEEWAYLDDLIPNKKQ